MCTVGQIRASVCSQHCKYWVDRRTTTQIQRKAPTACILLRPFATRATNKGPQRANHYLAPRLCSGRNPTTISSDSAGRSGAGASRGGGSYRARQHTIQLGNTPAASGSRVTEGLQAMKPPMHMPKAQQDSRLAAERTSAPCLKRRAVERVDMALRS